MKTSQLMVCLLVQFRLVGKVPTRDTPHLGHAGSRTARTPYVARPSRDIPLHAH